MSSPAGFLDTLTVLRCEPGRRAAKIIRRAQAGVTIDGYDCGAWFQVARVPVGSLSELAETAESVSRDPLAFIIRGEPLEGVDLRRCRRLLHAQDDGTPPTFREVPRRSVLFDFDTAEPCRLFDWRDGALQGLWLRSKLPPEFHSSSFWWQYTSSAGFAPGLRMRLAFWLDRPVTGEELGRWLATAPVDHATLRPVQPIYVARPLLRGVSDQVPERSGIEWDSRDEVTVPDLQVEKRKPPEVVAGERRRVERTMPARRHGWPYAVLEDVARAIATTPAASRNRWNGDGRHHALYCGALRVSGL